MEGWGDIFAAVVDAGLSMLGSMMVQGAVFADVATVAAVIVAVAVLV